MQRTFGTIVGMESVVPSGPHPDDIVVSADGVEFRRGDAYLDCRGCAHSSDEDRDEANLRIVAEVLDGIDEWVSEYCRENGDYASGYDHIVQEVSHDWPGPVEEWIRDNYDYSDDVVGKLVDAVCEALDGSFDAEAQFNGNEYAAYSGDGCCLWGTDIGEYEEQVDISYHKEFAALAESGELVDYLGRVNCNAYVSSSGLQWLQRDLTEGRDYPCFYTYHMPGGRWDWVVSAERMRELVCEAIIDICRS